MDSIYVVKKIKYALCVGNVEESGLKKTEHLDKILGQINTTLLEESSAKVTNGTHMEVKFIYAAEKYDYH